MALLHTEEPATDRPNQRAARSSRELRRNALPRGGYLPVHAEGCCLERRQRPAVLERDAELGRFVRERLLEGWTPERIAGWLKRGEERGLRPVSTETVYAFVHRAEQKAEKLWKLLPRGRARRGRRRARQSRGTITERRSIHDRPAEVQERQAAGHWEGDLLICKRTRPVLVLKERKTRFVLAARLAGKSAAETVAIMMAVFRWLDLVLRRLRLLAERRGRERQRPATAQPAARPRPRRTRRHRAAGDRPHPQPDSQEVPRLPHPAPGTARGAWQERPDPLRLTRCPSLQSPPASSSPWPQPSPTSRS